MTPDPDNQCKTPESAKQQQSGLGVLEDWKASGSHYCQLMEVKRERNRERNKERERDATDKK